MAGCSELKYAAKQMRRGVESNPIDIYIYIYMHILIYIYIHPCVAQCYVDLHVTNFAAHNSAQKDFPLDGISFE